MLCCFACLLPASVQTITQIDPAMLFKLKQEKAQQQQQQLIQQVQQQQAAAAAAAGAAAAAQQQQHQQLAMAVSAAHAASVPAAAMDGDDEYEIGKDEDMGDSGAPPPPPPPPPVPVPVSDQGVCLDRLTAVQTLLLNHANSAHCSLLLCFPSLKPAICLLCRHSPLGSCCSNHRRPASHRRRSLLCHPLARCRRPGLNPPTPRLLGPRLQASHLLVLLGLRPHPSLQGFPAWRLLLWAWVCQGWAKHSQASCPRRHRRQGPHL